MDKNTGSVIVSWDFSRDKDQDILIVGSQENGKMNILNAFQGNEARFIYNTLTTRKTLKEHKTKSEVGE